MERLSDIADALAAADTDLAELMFVCCLQGEVAEHRDRRIALIADRLGADPDLTGQALARAMRLTELIHVAERVFRALVPHEREFQAFLRALAA